MIACVEDDRSIRELVVYALQSSGYEAVGCENGSQLSACLSAGGVQLILLDIMLPGEDGMTILRRLKGKSQTKDIPVIMLTAKSSEFDKVMGLDGGADDYMAKPFGVMELISRVKAVLRRAGKSDEEKTLTAAGMTLFTEKHKLVLDGKDVPLTLKEFMVLQYLMENRGIVLTREKLLSVVWGYDYEGETRTVDVHINTLRQKLGTRSGVIETVRGVGYRLDESI